MNHLISITRTTPGDASLKLARALPAQGAIIAISFANLTIWEPSFLPGSPKHLLGCPLWNKPAKPHKSWDLSRAHNKPTIRHNFQFWKWACRCGLVGVRQKKKLLRHCELSWLVAEQRTSKCLPKACLSRISKKYPNNCLPPESLLGAPGTRTLSHGHEASPNRASA